MKILEAFGEPICFGGQEAFAFSVLTHMEMTGIDCLTAYQWGNEQLKRAVEEKGGKTYALNLPFEPGKSRESIRKPFRAFLKDHQYDTVHIHSGSISVLAIMASEAKRAGACQVIVHSHSTGTADSLKHKALRLAASFPLSRCADVYCACSKEAAEWKFMPKYAAQTRIIKNGIDLDKYRYDSAARQNMRKQLGFSGQDFVIGHVGRFSREKNHPYLIEIFAAAAQRNADARLLLVGEGEDRPAIQNMAAEKNLERRVLFTGAVTNVQDYMQAMDVFVFPSLFEGMPIVTIEAQATGLPVIASDRVPREIEISGVHFLSLEETPERWAEEALRFRSYQRQDQACAIREAGFDIHSTAAEVFRLYQA